MGRSELRVMLLRYGLAYCASGCSEERLGKNASCPAPLLSRLPFELLKCKQSLWDLEIQGVGGAVDHRMEIALERHWLRSCFERDFLLVSYKVHLSKMIILL